MSVVRIHPDEIRFEFIRSSGPGGQNVNKVATSVQLRFDVRNSKSVSPEIRERILRMAGRRATSSGEIIIEARRFRTQKLNREDALCRLYQLIERATTTPRVRRKSLPTHASKIRRLEEKRHRSEIKRLRAGKLPDD